LERKIVGGASPDLTTSVGTAAGIAMTVEAHARAAVRARKLTMLTIVMEV
jgi:hypothetical protein